MAFTLADVVDSQPQSSSKKLTCPKPEARKYAETKDFKRTYTGLPIGYRKKPKPHDRCRWYCGPGCPRESY